MHFHVGPYNGWREFRAFGKSFVVLDAILHSAHVRIRLRANFHGSSFLQGYTSTEVDLRCMFRFNFFFSA
jgi:hypothetical protein